MLRSEVNGIIRDAERFITSFGFKLPPFAYWSPAEMKAHTADAKGIFRSRMGWDITDFGKGKFDKLGLVLFTVRNGTPDDLAKGRGMVYAEKIMISRGRQMAPMHRHNIKTEDIINRGGAKLGLELYMSKPDGSIDPTAEVRVTTDGIERRLKGGGTLHLSPGESVTLVPGVWHAFWGEGGDVLIGEVSSVNDDLTDNVFREKIGRFSEITEDEPATHLLVSDYERAVGTV
jgi:D-lyxose ketol-isomerase